MPRFLPNEWLVEHVRVTAFTVADLPSPEERVWWMPVVGSEPESRLVKPRVGGLEESGLYEAPGLGNSRLTLVSEPRRSSGALRFLRCRHRRWFHCIVLYQTQSTQP